LVDEEDAHFFVTVRVLPRSADLALRAAFGWLSRSARLRFSVLGSRFERETVGTTNFTEGTNEGEEGPFFAKALKGSLRSEETGRKKGGDGNHGWHEGHEWGGGRPEGGTTGRRKVITLNFEL